MKFKLLKYKTRSLLRSNAALRTSLPYKQMASVGILFTVEDRHKHDDVKELIRRLEGEGKHVRVMTFLPKHKDNYEFLFDFFTEKDISFWGALTSESAISFSDAPFDVLFYLDPIPNPLLLHIVARSKARCRVGRYREDLVPFFEMMINSGDTTRSLIEGISRYATKLR